MFGLPFINGILEFFREPSIAENVEAYIVRGNPQTPDDVERLEREYWDKQRRNSILFFHE